MCGRFSQGEPSRHLADYFGAYPDEDLPDGVYNVPPTDGPELLRPVDLAQTLWSGPGR